mgnify:CR=1 FL=1
MWLKNIKIYGDLIQGIKDLGFEINEIQSKYVKKRVIKKNNIILTIAATSINNDDWRYVGRLANKNESQLINKLSMSEIYYVCQELAKTEDSNQIFELLELQRSLEIVKEEIKSFNKTKEKLKNLVEKTQNEIKIIDNDDLNNEFNQTLKIIDTTKI